MGGFLLHQGAKVLCRHGGQAQPVTMNPQVRANKQPVVTQTDMYAVAGCAFPPASGGPCVTGKWISASLRVKANKQPVLLQNSKAICAPTGTGLNTVTVQTRVKCE